MKIVATDWGTRTFLLAVKPFLPFLAAVACVVSLAGCGGGSPSIPDAAAVKTSAPDAQAIFDACLKAHGGAAAYARLHDVNVRFDSHWAALGPKLQPVLSDRGHRQGSEERYLPVRGGFVVGQTHQGPEGTKHVFRRPGAGATVFYQPPPAKHRINPDGSDADPEVSQAAGLVTDAYSMFLFGPGFFVQRGAKFQTVAGTADVDGHACDQVVTSLDPGLGTPAADKVVLFIDRQDHLLRRVQFTLNALESTKGAEVHVDLMAQRPLAGVMWPTRYSERIDRPVNLPAHQWSLLGFDVNRGESAADLAGPAFKGKAAAPAKPVP